MNTKAPTQSGPLAGCRVLELGAIIAGPYCGRLFADFGAEVIKVEPIEGDGLRLTGKRVNGKSLYAASLLRNKKLLSVDLRTKEGQEIIRKIVPQIDIVIENFRPGNLEKWSLGYEDLARIHPGLIMVRISGFGQTGPYSPHPGYGVIAEAMSSLRHLTGEPDRPPARVGVPLTDYITGLHAAFGAMIALHHRSRTGEGQCVDAALYECAFSFVERSVPEYEKLGIVANRTGSALADVAPNNLYRTKDDRYIHISGPYDSIFRRLACVIGRPDLPSDERFKTVVARASNAKTLDNIISAWAAQHVLVEIEQTLSEAGVPASRIYTIADIFEDPHYRAREMLVKVPDDDLGSVTLAAPVPKLSRTPGVIRKSGGRIGQDTRAILMELGGYSIEELQTLEHARIIHSAA